ncbi:hypothetical protein BC833DRAFT_662938 [Globomyces pollinis-pini]|nr:hypothetical protein BC833DRAFT_662938 [Globomyces pollinis-pini]
MWSDNEYHIQGCYLSPNMTFDQKRPMNYIGSQYDNSINAAIIRNSLEPFSLKSEYFRGALMHPGASILSSSVGEFSLLFTNLKVRFSRTLSLLFIGQSHIAHHFKFIEWIVIIALSEIDRIAAHPIADVVTLQLVSDWPKCKITVRSTVITANRANSLRTLATTIPRLT